MLARLASILERALRRFPLLREIVGRAYARSLAARFPGSGEYWIRRYKAGGSSGDGSIGEARQFKAEVLNGFVRRHGIQGVIEFGCGDGGQLALASYPSYVGFDVSPDALALCAARFSMDPTKRFKLMNDYDGEVADLTLSLDVIYHLVEEAVFKAYMERLFLASTRFVIIYSSDTSEQDAVQGPHVRHREFSRWVDEHVTGWSLIERIRNTSLDEATRATRRVDFFVYEKTTRDG